MTEVVSLLPCPFCGSTNIDSEGWVSTDRAGPACDECSGSADTIELWNTRPIQSELLEACKAALLDCEADDWANSDLAVQLRTAIAKATGTSTLEQIETGGHAPPVYVDAKGG